MSGESNINLPETNKKLAGIDASYDPSGERDDGSAINKYGETVNFQNPKLFKLAFKSLGKDHIAVTTELIKAMNKV